MIRILFDASTYDMMEEVPPQNPYGDPHMKINKKRAMKQHQDLLRTCSVYPTLVCPLPHKAYIPDIVFCASAGLSLPRLGHPLVVLPNMKYHQRKDELPYIKEYFKRIKLPTIEYPGSEPFEGQAEVKWFDGGKKMVCGYGYRSTKKTYEELDQLFDRLYGKDKPEMLVLPLISPYFYHLDLAMLGYHDQRCIVQRKAFSPTSIRKLERFLGKENVTVIDSSDTFALNAIIDGAHLISHPFTDPNIQKVFESTTGLISKQVNVSEFEKSGGAVRCMVFDVYLA